MTTGTSAALYCRISGGVMPGGSGLVTDWQSAVTWAIAAFTSAPGWKNILITLVPRTDCDSMCSMLLTVVVSARSTIVVMRSCISVGDRLP